MAKVDPVWWLVWGMALLGLAPASALAAPFVTLPPRAMAVFPTCPPPPAAMVSLQTSQPYVAGDASFSRMDGARKVVRDAQVRPISDFVGRVTTFSNRYVASNGRDVNSGACALLWLGAWADAGALTQVGGEDSQFLRSINLNGLAMGYLQVAGLNVRLDDKRPAIRAWMAAMALDLARSFNASTSTTAYNNHRYWAAAAVASVGEATGRLALLTWAYQSARIGLDRVTPEGALPLELARKSRARQYHLYAAAPLVEVAEIARARNVDLYGYRGGALHRLVRFSITSVTNPQRITALSGAVQEPFVTPGKSYHRQHSAWFELYARRFPDKAVLGAALLRDRPLVNAEMGGDLTMLARGR